MSTERPDRLPFVLGQRVKLKLTGRPCQVISILRNLRSPTEYLVEFVTGTGEIASAWLVAEQIEKVAAVARKRASKTDGAAA